LGFNDEVQVSTLEELSITIIRGINIFGFTINYFYHEFLRILDQWMGPCSAQNIPFLQGKKVSDEFKKRIDSSESKEKLNLSGCDLTDQNV
jgi:hypothetical protein